MSKIAWTEKTWNPVVGCTKVSPGCKNCYAEKWAGRLAGMGQEKYDYVTEWYHATETKNKRRWNNRVAIDKSALDKITPRQKPKMIFVDSMGDLFHPSVPFEFIDHIALTMSLAEQHTYQILTKRPKRALAYHRRWINQNDTNNLFRHNVWFGISAENQEWWEKRKQAFFDTPAAIHFVSFEPLLGEIILSGEDLKQLDWVIIGAESNGAYPGRECKLIWISNIVEQCRQASVPCFVKQIHLWSKKSYVRLEKDPKQIKAWHYPQQYPKGDQ